MKRATLAVALATGTALVAAPVAAAAAPAQPPDSTSLPGPLPVAGTVFDEVAPVAWGECDIPLQPGSPPVPANYQCALYPVPVDWSDPDNGETVEIALIRRPAGPVSAGESGAGAAEAPAGAASAAEQPAEVSTPARAPLGSLFVHPGGPSGSGVELVGFIGEFLYAEEVLESYDIVGFDSRFTGYSEGLQCFTGTEDPDDYFSDDYIWPETRDEIRQQNRLNRNVERLCRRNAEPERDFMSTTDVAHDLALLHQAVGDPQLNLAGYSYGSLVFSYFDNLYPDRVGAMIADGVVDPLAWATGYTEEDPPPVGTVEERDADVPLWHRFNDGSAQLYTTEEFLRLCDEAGPELCAFAPNAAERYDALLAAVSEEPAVVSFPDFVVDDQLLSVLTFGTLYSAAQMPVLASDLAFIESVVARQADPASAEADEVAQRIEQALASVPFPVNTGGREQFWGVLCGDARDPNRIRAWADAAADPFGPFGPAWAWADSACEDWTGRDRDRYEGPWNAELDTPVLVASTTYDPATPFEGARVLSERLPDSTLLTVEGWGHTTLFTSSCAIELQTSYLLTRELPGGEVTCAQDALPFGVPASATPVDRYGTPVREEPATAGSTDDGVVDTEEEVREVAQEQAVPEDLLADEVVEELADLALSEEEAELLVKGAAADEAFDRALEPAPRELAIRP